MILFKEKGKLNSETNTVKEKVKYWQKEKDKCTKRGREESCDDETDNRVIKGSLLNRIKKPKKVVSFETSKTVEIVDICGSEKVLNDVSLPTSVQFNQEKKVVESPRSFEAENEESLSNHHVGLMMFPK